MNEEKKRELEQHKFNALVAKTMHELEINKIEGKRNFFTGTTIISPIIITSLMYFSKGTTCENIVNVISFIVSILIVIYSIYVLISKQDDLYYEHKKYKDKNLEVNQQLQNFLVSETAPSEEILNWYCKYITEIDQNDSDLIKNVKNEIRQLAYREALKQVAPGVVRKCDNCNQSPWDFKKSKGDKCPVCGCEIKKGKKNE